MTVLFCDCNGTVLDDTPICNESIRRTFLAHDKRPPTSEEFFRELDTGDYLEVYRKRGVIASRDELNKIFIPNYKARMWDVKLLPGVKKTLSKLRGKGIRLALVTTQQETLVMPLLKKFEIDSLFHHCSFHTLDKKSEILKILREEKADPEQAYFIGDAPSDMRQAKKAGVNTIALLTCHIPEDLLRATNADHYIRSFSQLLELI